MNPGMLLASVILGSHTRDVQVEILWSIQVELNIWQNVFVFTYIFFHIHKRVPLT